LPQKYCYRQLGGSVTRRSIREYAQAVRERYRRADKATKGKMLDEFCEVTQYNRKAVIRLLGERGTKCRGRGGRPRKYGPRVVDALRVAWEASGHLCSKLLSPFLVDLVPMLERTGTLELEPQTRGEVLGLSAATIDRMLKPYRGRELRRPYTQSKCSVSIRSQVPVRTFGEWEGVEPGSMQGDLVLHCGESTAGFCLSSLVMVDVATGWTEVRVVWGKTQSRVRGGLERVRRGLPFELRELHTDNGGEFLNESVYPYCKGKGIRLSRGRPYKKNDQAYVEQKNWAVVRRVIGYDRYGSKVAYEQMEKLYRLMWMEVNFLRPVRKLVGKEREGGKVRKRYDRARTPYARLIESGVLSQESRERLDKVYARLKPVELRGQIEQALEELWKVRSNGQIVGTQPSLEGRLSLSVAIA
jgi:Integrase core domain